MITQLNISGYRSLRDIGVELEMLNVVTGANGSGKSSLYRALRLLADVAHGNIIRALAAEGGLGSTIWAGPEKFSRAMKAGEQPIQALVPKNPTSLKLGFATDDYGYAVDLGLPMPGHPFSGDPQIKVESLWVGQVLRRHNEIARRNGPLVRVRDGGGEWQQVMTDLSPFDSMMTHASDPRDAIELLRLREHMREWRFYDHFRTDRDAPARHRQIGTYTPVLASDGSDLAAAVKTLRHIGDPDLFDHSLDDAFPGAVIASEGDEIIMRQKGLLRPLRMAELSDGTLRYLLLMAALLSPRPAPLMILNEPEMSLHPDLLPPLGRLIAKAAERSQTVVVSHAPALIAAIEEAGPARRIVLEKRLGETLVNDGERLDWEWPSR